VEKLRCDFITWSGWMKNKGEMEDNVYVGTSLKFGGNLVRNKQVWTNMWKCQFEEVQYISVTLEGQ
jgi:hypothetical protein